MRDLTTGSVSRHLLQTAGFMLVTMLFQTLYFLADLYWVGHLGKEAVAAVGVSGNLLFISLALSQMLGVGTTTLISHAAGRKEHGRALVVFNQAQLLSLLVALGFLVVSSLLRGFYASGLSADPETARLAFDYLRWFLPALSLQFVVVAMGAGLRGVGLFVPGMVVQSATVLLNIVLAPVLIFGWFTHRPLGVTGAAIATFVAVVVSTIWIVTYFLPRSSYLRFVRRDWRPRPDLWGQLLQVGLPAGAEFALMSVYLFVVYYLSRPFGAAAQAGFGIGMRVMQAGFMPVVALGFSVAPVAGQNFGAHQAERVRETMRVAIRLVVSVMIVFAVSCHIAPAAMIRVFSKDPQVIAVGVEYLKYVSWNFVAAGVVFVSSSMFQAIGNTIPSLMASFVRVTVAVVPALLLSRLPGFRLTWMWELAVTAVTVQMTLSLLLLRRELRLRLAFAPPAEAVAPAAPVEA